MSISEFQNNLQPDDIVCSLKAFSLNALSVVNTPLVSIFDDNFFENYDFDIISGPDRKRIQLALKKDGWLQKSSRSFLKDNIHCGFPKPSHTLGCNPADKVIESWGVFDYMIVTPTQALLVMALKGPWELTQVAELAFYQGCNLDKVKQWIKHDKLSVRFPVDFLKDVQRNGYLKRKGQKYRDLQSLFAEHDLVYESAP